LVLPGPTEVPFNRHALPAASPDLVSGRCDSAHNLLAFTSSTLGESFYLPAHKFVSFYQFQPDPYFANHRIVAFGRYALFQVLGATSGERIVLELTHTLNHDASNLLPPASAVGAYRVPLPLLGRGSARVFSPPLRPQMIAGTPYVLVDMGVAARPSRISRHGLQGLYGRAVTTDPRNLTGYVRDISLVGQAQYATLHAPSVLRRFPSDLEDPGLEYSGLYEDGWMGADGYVRLAGGPSAELRVQGQVPAGAGKRLQLVVNGRQAANVAVIPGQLDVRARIPASTIARVVELRFAAEIKLSSPDLRPAAARLTFLGVIAHKR